MCIRDSLYADGGLYREIIDSNARTLNIGRLAATVLPAGAGVRHSHRRGEAAGAEAEFHRT